MDNFLRQQPFLSEEQKHQNLKIVSQSLPQQNISYLNNKDSKLYVENLLNQQQRKNQINAETVGKYLASSVASICSSNFLN